MTEYTVIWEINTESNSPLEAALEAETLMQSSPGGFRPYFKVINDSTKEETLIDLEDQP